ncbi:MAG: class I SAM-dependent methyltransferase [Leptospirillum sp.]
MTFRDFMERSLSDQRNGYYTRNARIGFASGDFYTAPELSPVFALMMSRQIAEADAILNHPSPFYLMEAGPGNGTLMRDILVSLRLLTPGLFQRIQPLLYEISPVLLARQKESLSGLSLFREPVWVTPEQLSRMMPFTGMILGNEFLDALPVHRLKKNGSEVQEIYVEQTPDGNWTEISAPLSDPSLVQGIYTHPSDYPDSFEWEVQADLCRVVGEMDQVLERGFMLWVDYGDTAEDRQSTKRSKGSLLGYQRHTVVEDVLKAPAGTVDITVHVDFPLLARQALSLGMRLEGFSDQMHFLTAMGIEEYLSDGQFSEAEKAAMVTLIHPLRMGGAFKVMLLSKGIGSGFRWKGFPRSPLPL